MKHTELREAFLGFFKSKGHTVVPSDSLVPADDPTLLFTSAGMNQFKEQFMGHIKGYHTATSCQKCFRTPDLENVGKTAYHHTFFEMLGNFSFGDYFKEKAIAWAWEFMKDVLKIPEDRLWASVYVEDDEAYDIWKDRIGLPDGRIVKLGQKENFWPSEARDKGPNGPCGPCSEIFYDYGQATGCGKKDCTPACDCGRFVEVWNLVFTQFERKEGGALDPLPNKNIDTGMGLERLCAVMQGVKSNFETDLFVPIVKAIEAEVPNTQDEAQAAYLYAIADHVRAASFAIRDGVTPSNEDRGYVIRNIIRKAALHGRNLGIDKPFLYKLVYTVAKVMEAAYPEIMKSHEDISQVILAEEERFAATLKDGLRLINETIAATKAKEEKAISGEVAFKLFDTHGMPLIIIKEIAETKGIGVEEEGFNRLMQVQREQSRKASKMHAAVFVDSGIHEKTEFIGYDKCRSKAKVLRILTPDGDDIEKADTKAGKVEIILDKSVFYGEAGGQAGDTGTLVAKGVDVEIKDAKKLQDAVILEGVVKQGELEKGAVVDTAIDEKRRLAIAKNHTATHLLQTALRDVLGGHVQQQGSSVMPDRLRFDFTHFKALTEDELDRAQEKVNQYIKEKHLVKTKEMGLDEAKKSGALAFFGDKYDQKVTVVSAGDFSNELCGGTHLKNTKEIGLFRIMREGSVASGIRRIEACTSDAALEWEKKYKELEKENEKALQKKEQNKKLMRAKLKDASKEAEGIIEKAKDISGTKLIIARLEGAEANFLMKINDTIKAGEKSFAAFLVSEGSGKVNLLLSVSNNLVEKGIHAGKIISGIAKLASGSGGGKPEMAMGGAKDTSKIGDMLKAAEDILTKEISS